MICNFVIFLECVGSRACLSAKGAEKISQSETKAFKFINLKAFFLFVLRLQIPEKANTRQSLRSKSYPQETGVKWGAICLELWSCCRALFMSYNTQNDIVNRIL